MRRFFALFFSIALCAASLMFAVQLSVLLYNYGVVDVGGKDRVVFGVMMITLALYAVSPIIINFFSKDKKAS